MGKFMDKFMCGNPGMSVYDRSVNAPISIEEGFCKYFLTRFGYDDRDMANAFIKTRKLTGLFQNGMGMGMDSRGSLWSDYRY